MRNLPGNRVSSCLVLSTERYQRSSIEAEVATLPSYLASRVRIVPHGDGSAIFVLTPSDDTASAALHNSAAQVLIMAARELSVPWAEFSVGGCGAQGEILSTSLEMECGATATLDHNGMPIGPGIEACGDRDETLILVRGRVDLMQRGTSFSCDVSTPGRTAAAEIMRAEAQRCRTRFWTDPAGSCIRSMVLVGMTSGSVRVADALWLGTRHHQTV